MKKPEIHGYVVVINGDTVLPATFGRLLKKVDGRANTVLDMTDVDIKRVAVHKATLVVDSRVAEGEHE